MWQSVSVGVLFYVMSLSIGKAPLPLADGLVRHVEPGGQILLGQAQGPALAADEISQPLLVHVYHLAFSLPQRAGFGNRPAVERRVLLLQGAVSTGDAPLLVLSKKRMRRAQWKRKRRLARSGAVALRATGVGVSVPASIWPCLRARYSLLRGRYFRPVADGVEVIGMVVALTRSSFRCRWPVVDVASAMGR